MLYIIDKSKPFTGSVENTMDENGMVHYCHNTTFEQYKKAKGNPNLIYITEKELELKMNEYRQSLQQDWREITLDEYEYALEVLPPQGWHRVGHFDVFHFLEPYFLGIHDFYIHDTKTGKCYTALRNKHITDQELLDQLSKL